MRQKADQRGSSSMEDRRMRAARSSKDCRVKVKVKGREGRREA
jgi:hypothetical protein